MKQKNLLTKETPIIYTKLISDTNMLDKTEPPTHLAIIQDGNRRYALQKGHSAYKGHEEGVETTEKILQLSKEAGIKNLTVYAFSTENFRRNESELNDLFELFKKEFERIPTNERIHENEIKIRVIGDLDLMSEEVREAVRKAEKSTEDYDNFNFNIALAYGGKREIRDSIKLLSKKIKQGKLKASEIDEKTFLKHLYPHNPSNEIIPEIDLLIRTGGEKRLSNFLLWRSINATVYFSDVYWPAFGEKEFKKALARYHKLKE
ncbi:di-trans,poly-cis-decaprenylcistransferase [archaeon SCG-AAA382B04]|nr:di-trans,poly-cis-decaprenylcistransferase [archaeon SCG-AAA382B04]